MGRLLNAQNKAFREEEAGNFDRKGGVVRAEEAAAGRELVPHVKAKRDDGLTIFAANGALFRSSENKKALTTQHSDTFTAEQRADFSVTYAT